MRYSFRALTAQEAYETYGVAPYASDIMAATATLWVCLKNLYIVCPDDYYDVQGLIEEA